MARQQKQERKPKPKKVHTACGSPWDKHTLVFPPGQPARPIWRCPNEA